MENHRITKQHKQPTRSNYSSRVVHKFNYNCLEYEPFKSSDEEWDNIPEVIPRMLYYMEACINGLSQSCKDFSQYESTATLRRWVDDELRSIERQVAVNRDADLKEKQLLKDKDEELVEQQCMQYNLFESFVEDVTTKKGVGYGEMEEVLLPYIQTLKPA